MSASRINFTFLVVIPATSPSSASCGSALLMATLFGLYPFLPKLYVDGGYQGAGFYDALALFSGA
jgi:hypothetical protein